MDNNNLSDKYISESDQAAIDKFLAKNRVPNSAIEQSFPQNVYQPVNTPSPVQSNSSSIDYIKKINDANRKVLEEEQKKAEEERRRIEEEENRLREEEKKRILEEKAREEAEKRAAIDDEVNRRLEERKKELEKEYVKKPKFSLFGKKDKTKSEPVKDTPVSDTVSLTQPESTESKSQKTHSKPGKIISKRNIEAEKRNKLPSSPVSPEFTTNQADLARLAFVDEKLSINNANAYKTRMESIADPVPKGITFIFVDANNLKYVNDNFGHDAGDRFLSLVASSLKLAFGDNNAYRQGGDEFAAVIERVENITPLIHKLKNNLEEVHNKENLPYPCSVSVGYATSDGRLTKDTLLKNADTMMYEEKSKYHSAHPEYDMRGNRLPFQNLKQETKFTFDDIYEYLSENADDIYTVLLADIDYQSLWIFQDIGTCFDMVNEMDINKSSIAFCIIITEDEYKFYGTDLDDVVVLKPLIKVLKKRITQKELAKFGNELSGFDNIYMD